jgi:hypothetical protein
MAALDRLIPHPHLLEIDRIDLAAPPAKVWALVRHGDLAQSRFTRALFAIRTLAGGSRTNDRTTASIRIDDLKSSPARPGFQVLVDDPPCEVAVAAIGKVWRLDIPFVHVPGAGEFAVFRDPDFIKVAWAIRVSPRGEHDTHVELEVRVEATDDGAWRKFKRYFRVIGPFSRAIRRSLLRALARDVKAPEPQRYPEDDPSPDSWQDVLEGVLGGSRMAFALATPFLRDQRNRWGLNRATAERELRTERRRPHGDTTRSPNYGEERHRIVVRRLLCSHAMGCVMATSPVLTRRSLDLVALIRSEYLEMPGLCLTLPQAARLWNTDQRECSSAFESLVQEGFLCRSRDLYLRRGGGRV